ncbi:MAG TPA: M48 family metallopeptidase [Candidatus Baltobacteraceae bacterium]|nr:M48 family metallopeptidase [Candidatus Baltobacteraceae bacterium]
MKLLLVLAVLLAAMPAVPAGPSAEESALDNEAYRIQQPHIVTSGREAAALAFVAGPIGRAAARLYGVPFHYYLIDEDDPDAFSYYGPRVYVSRGMMHMADFTEELAGVLCHESSHVLHHDGLHSAQELAADNASLNAFLHKAMHMTHNHFARVLSLMGAAGKTLEELHYSRAQEENADLSGADLCSQAGSNPWGIAWMLEKFQKAAPSHRLAWFSDHPSTKARIARLKKKLRGASFAHWPSTQAVGTDLGL